MKEKIEKLLQEKVEKFERISKFPLSFFKGLEAYKLDIQIDILKQLLTDDC